MSVIYFAQNVLWFGIGGGILIWLLRRDGAYEEAASIFKWGAFAIFVMLIALIFY